MSDTEKRVQYKNLWLFKAYWMRFHKWVQYLLHL